MLRDNAAAQVSAIADAIFGAGKWQVETDAVTWLVKLEYRKHKLVLSAEMILDLQYGALATAFEDFKRKVDAALWTYSDLPKTQRESYAKA